MANDNVKHPSHYLREGFECIQIIRIMLGHEGFMKYCEGNAIKYEFRYREKNGVEDLRKAQEYLGFMIDELEGKFEIPSFTIDDFMESAEKLTVGDVVGVGVNKISGARGTRYPQIFGRKAE